MVGVKEEYVERKGRKSDSFREARHALAKSRRWLFLLLLVEQNWLCIDAAAEDLQRRTGMLERMQQQEVLEEVRSGAESTWRLEPEGETEVPEINFVSDAVRGTQVDLDGKNHLMKRMKEIPKNWRQPKGADWNEMRRDAGGGRIEVRFAEWIGLEHRKEIHEKIQRHV